MIRTQEQIAEDLYRDTYRAVARFLEQYDVSPLTIERTASEAAEIAVDQELDPENER